jgi:hypothetical protein
MGEEQTCLVQRKKTYRRIVGTSHGRHPRQDKTTRHHRKRETETTRQDAWAEKRERANQALLHKDRIILSPPLLISYSAQERNHSKASKFTRKCYSARSMFRREKRERAQKKRSPEQCVVVRPISPSFHVLSYSCSLSKVTDQHDHTQRLYSQDVWPLFS